MLIGFTVMQHAFAGGITHGIVSDVERRALALTGAGDMIWDWDVSADKIYTSPETEHILGLKRGALEGAAAAWLDVLHPLDRDRFRASLDSAVEQRRGRLTQDFRLRAQDGHYRLVHAEGAAGGRLRRRGGAPGRHAHRRDRVQEGRGAAAVRRGARQPHRPAQPRTVPRPHGGGLRLRPLRSADQAVGAGDRYRPLQAGQRFGRHWRSAIPSCSPSRAGSAACSSRRTRWRGSAGDQFALILLSEKEPARIVAFAETLRRTLRAPIAFNDREIFLTASIGLALAENQPHRTEEVLKDAELAMYHAKRIGGDRIESLQAGHALAQDRPADARIGIAPRHRARGDQGAVPADRAAGRPLPSPASRRWRAGIIPRWAGCRRRNSSPSPRRSG